MKPLLGSLAVSLLFSWPLFAAKETPPAVSAGSTMWTTACSSAAAPAPHPFSFSNEAPLQYKVSWGAVTAGRGTIEVKEPDLIDGVQTPHLSMHIQTTGVTAAFHHYDEQSDSWINPETSLPVRYTKQTRESHYLQDEAVNLDQLCRRYDRWAHRLDKGLTERKQDVLPGEALDILGYLFYARELPLAEGAHFEVTLMSGDHLWPITVRVGKLVTISSGGHKYSCFFLEPVLHHDVGHGKLSQVQLWISADARRLPVRLRMQANVGHITAELVESRKK